jgi:hypothetical protein
MAGNFINLDLRDTSPANARPFLISDHVPEGRYLMRIRSISEETSGNGNDMIVVRMVIDDPMSEYNNKRIIDRFIKDKAGMSRFRGMVLHAFGTDLGNQQVQFDINSILNAQLGADLEDNTLPAQGKYEKRETSQVAAYLPKSKVTGDGLKSGTKPKTTHAAVRKVEPELDPEDSTSEPELEPVKAATKVAPLVSKQPSKVVVPDISEDDDDNDNDVPEVDETQFDT